MSTTLENEAMATVENEATQTRQIGWVISVEDWALIRRLVADGVPQRKVARDLGIGRSTVERALASDRPPKYERAGVPTTFAPFEPLVRQLLKDHPDMEAVHLYSAILCNASVGCRLRLRLRLRLARGLNLRAGDGASRVKRRIRGSNVSRCATRGRCGLRGRRTRGAPM